jgi:hypothetical protein
VRAVDLAHSAAAEESADFEAAKPAADKIVLDKRLFAGCSADELHEAFSGGRLIQQPLHVTAQLVVASRRAQEKSSAVCLRSGTDGVEQVFDALPPFRSHGHGSEGPDSTPKPGALDISVASWRLFACSNYRRESRKTSAITPATANTWRTENTNDHFNNSNRAAASSRR